MYVAPQGRPRSVPPVGFEELLTDALASSESPKAQYHSEKWYEVRASKAFRRTLTRANVESYRREERATRALAKRLNAAETAGVWMTGRQYGELYKCGSNALRARGRSNKWPVRAGSGKRICLVLVPTHIAAGPSTVEATPAPALPWWRKFLAWVWA